MLSLSLKCRELTGHQENDTRQVVFSNVEIRQPVEGSIFSLVPTGAVGAAWAYSLRVRVFSEPMQAGTIITPLEYVLDDVRALLSYLLDIQLHPDVDGCRALSGERLGRDLSRLIPNRFEPERRISAASLAESIGVFESLISAADDHLLLVQRAVAAYEHGLFALAQGQRDLAYILLIFVLECLAQARPTPERVEWEAYPPAQRTKLDRAMTKGQVSNEAAQHIREVLCATRHLRVTDSFREFVLGALGTDFFAAEEHVDNAPRGRRLRRSLMPRLLNEAYVVRSGYAHELAPIAHAVSAEWRDDFCELRTGSPALTFRGLHRVVRGVMSTVLAERRAPTAPVAPPDTPGIALRRWSYQYWIYKEVPRPDGADATYWMNTLLSLHLAFCTGPESSKGPPRPIPVKAIGAHVASATPDKKRRPAMLALARICGHDPPPGQAPKFLLETLVAQVFVDGTCGADASAAAKLMEKTIGGDSNALLGLPPLVLVAVSLAIARGFEAKGDDTAHRQWFERARDDAAHDGQLQARLNDSAEQGSAITPHDLLFPRTAPGRLLEGFTDPPTTRGDG